MALNEIPQFLFCMHYHHLNWHELRILPATGSGGLINIHCIFNPDTTFLAKLENDFFASLEDSGGNKMNRYILFLTAYSVPNSFSNNS
jgi:hypothetical protein